MNVHTYRKYMYIYYTHKSSNGITKLLEAMSSKIILKRIKTQLNTVVLEKYLSINKIFLF